MPRPRKWRLVCCLPDTTEFGPLGAESDERPPITMTVDEYETIRLIDLEEMTQQQCADQMEVARSTVQGIYDTARKKLAQAVIFGRVLCIAGGEYRLCEGEDEGCRRRHCRGRGQCCRFNDEIGGNT